MKQVAKVERNALQEYEITPEKVKKLVKGYMTLTVLPEDQDSYKTAHKAKMVCVKTRTSVDKRRKQLGEDARTWVKEVNAAAKQLLEPMTEAEDHLKSELGKEDARVEAIRQAKIDAEEMRVAEIQEYITQIQNYRLHNFNNRDSSLIKELIDQLMDHAITPEVYMEFYENAINAQNESLKALDEAYKNRLKWESEQAAAKVEAERLEKIRLEQEARAKELADEYEKMEAHKKKIEDELAAEKAKLEAEKKTEQDRLDKIELERAAKEQAEKDYQAELKVKEEERIAEEKKEVEEKARQEALKPDKEKLIAWAKSFDDCNVLPDVKDVWCQGLVVDFANKFDELVEDLKKRIEAV